MDDTFDINHLKIDRIPDQSDIYFDRSIEKISRKNFNSLWEIQPKDPFVFSIPKQLEYIRIKNLATGLFLSIDMSNNLILTKNGYSENAYFKIKKKTVNIKDEGKIRFNESLIILATQDDLRFELTNNFSDCSSNIKLQKKSYNSALSTFEFKSISQKNKNIGYRISSLFPYLFDFYLFLQKFGTEVNNNKTYYKYERAFQMEKDLEIKNEQLEESLENLYDFLTVKDINKEEEFEIKIKQFAVNDQEILYLLISIIKLIDSMIYKPYVNDVGNESLNEESTSYFQGKKNICRFKKNNKEIDKVDDKSPFFIARKYLENKMFEIYKILYLCIKKNGVCSENLLEIGGEFLSSRIDSSSPEISNLLKEAFR